MDAQPPTWAEFEHRPAAALELRSPAEELAGVLRRMRDDLDRAGRVGAELRLDALRALAEQAVLAVELEKLLERHGEEFVEPALEHAHRALGQLKDRMLERVAAAGLEIVRLHGAPAGEVADVVEIEGWRCEDIDVSPVVIAELEVAVRFEGAALRRGRVIMGGVGGADRIPSSSTSDVQPDVRPRPPAPTAPGGERPAPPLVVCPIASCCAENPAGAENCAGCLTPLGGFARLLLHPATLFNQGLEAARNGDSALARERFAAVALWLPHDVITRNAHALACLDGGDLGAARRGWEDVLKRAPGDHVATRGLTTLTREQS